jgi:hypothetical protein
VREIGWHIKARFSKKLRRGGFFVFRREVGDRLAAPENNI